MNEESPSIGDIDLLWQRRYDAATFAMHESLVRKALEASPREYGLHWRSARAFYFRSVLEEHGGNERAAVEALNSGKKAATDATNAERAGVEGWFWLGMAEVGIARRANKLAAMGAWKKAQEHLDRAARLDETYYEAGAIREVGRIIHRKPLLLGGSAGVAMQYFKKALDVAPGNSTTQLYYVEALMTEQQKVEARALLNEIIQAEDKEDWRWEQEQDKATARVLLKKL